MRYAGFLLIFLLLFSCNSKQEATRESEKLVMAPRSEMALLMNDMFAFNESIKSQVISGELNNSFPIHFNKIETAELTDPTDRNSSFESFSKEFIDKTKLLFEDHDSELKTRYNDVVNACISCHQTTCLGPIPRIKKLLIK